MLVTEYIKKNNIKAEIFSLDTPFPTNKHIARYFAIKERNIFVTQLLQGENKRLIMCIFPSDKRLNFKRVEEVSGIKRLRYADREVVYKTTGYEVGCIPLVGYKGDFDTVIDESVFEVDKGIGIAGEPTKLMKLTPEDIKQYNNGIVALIVK